MVKNPKDFYCGLLLVAIAAILSLDLLRLPIGSAFRMGPGYFPLVLILLLAALGLAILLNGLRVPGAPIGTLPWRAISFIVLPIVFFGATLKGLGLVPALAITVFASTFARREWSGAAALSTTVVLVGCAVGIFIYGLGLPISLYGPWIGGY